MPSWTANVNKQDRERKRRTREAQHRARRRKVDAVTHPVKAAKKRFLPWG